VSHRHVGLLVPIFSMRSTASWGIGELPDLAPLADWLASGGFDRLMILPLGTMTPGEPSPYSAASTMAIDPIYIALDRVDEFARAGGQARLSATARQAIERARASRAVDYAAVTVAKEEALRVAFDYFVGEDWTHHTKRAESLVSYVGRERWWLDDYALFRALTTAMAGARWLDWPAPLRERDPRALDEARGQLAREILQEQYRQWLAESQWQEARAHARARGVSVCGDLPFVSGTASADVWARPGDYRLDVSVGTPPDAFSADGQDWGMPMYRWDAVAASDFAWIRQRARRMAALFDGVRVDHLIGFYRTFGRPRQGAPFFSPGDEAAQLGQGEAVLRIFQSTGTELVAEDLGTVPDFLRASLSRLDVPGCKVLRWERHWHTPGQPFVDPRTFPERSVALTGTHDTTSVAVWWEEASREERARVLALPAFAGWSPDDVDAAWNDRLRDALLALAYHAGSAHLYLPAPDLFGWRDRINVPGTVGEANWTWSLPWPVDRLGDEPEASRRAAYARGLARAAARGITL
jgi:4-alpha-glucanotransferase